MCVIVLVQRNAAQALTALRALRSPRNAVSFEVIVLLNGADGSTVSAIQRGAGDATVIVSAANLGFGGGCNFAADRTDAEYLAFLNDDTVVDTGWLDALVAHADADPSVGAVGSRIRFPDGTLQEAGSILWSDGTTFPIGRGIPADGGSWRFRRTITYASACALLVRREDFVRVGGFDEAFFPAYYEDVDLCLALASIGKRVTFEPTAELVHFESQSSTSLFKSFLFRRNHRRLAQKWRSVLPSFETPEPEKPASVERAVEAAWGKHANVLVIDDRLPDAGLGSGYGRTLELIADLSGSSYRVRMHASADPVADARTVGLFEVGVIERSLEEELREDPRRYDLAIISRPHNYERFAGLIRELQPDCRVCYDVESLFYRRIEKQAAMEVRDDERRRLAQAAEEGRRLEFQIARSVDRLVCISTDERRLLEAIPGHAPIDFIVPVARNITVTSAAFEEREPIALFVAGWMAGDTSPNADGLRWLAGEIVPILREYLPYAKIIVTGGNPPASLLAHASPALEFAGYVSDLSALYARARVALSPLRFGAGVKIKTVEAVQHGVPVVATSVGAEGLAFTVSDAVTVADDARTFGLELVETLVQGRLWETRRRAAIAQSEAWRLEANCSWVDVCDSMMRDDTRDRAKPAPAAQRTI